MLKNASVMTPADVRTQAMYQLLDSGFIGLIFSCFSEDAQKVENFSCWIKDPQKWSCLFFHTLLRSTCFLFWIKHNLETCKIWQVGRIQVTAFQSSDGKQNHTLRPVSVSPVPKSSVVEIESSLSSSEKLLPRSGSTRGDGTEEDTGDSKASSGFYKVIPWSFRNVNSLC